MAYGLKYELLCPSRRGNAYKLQLLFDGYASSDIDRNMPSDTPLVLRKDKAAVIRGTSLEFGIREEVDFEFLEFYTNNPKMILAELYEDTDLLWTGYVLPQQYQCPYVPAPLTVRFTATDGLGLLKNEAFNLTGLSSQMAIICHCIDKINLGLSYRIAIDIFERDHDHDLSPLEQTYELADIYLGMSCYDVLEKMLLKYDAEITQSRGRWNIKCSIYKDSACMLYDSDGVYEGTENASTVLNLGQISNIAADVHPIGKLDMSLQPGGKQVTISHNYGRKDSLMPNWDFLSYVSPDFTGWTKTGSFNVLQKTDPNGKKYAFLEGRGYPIGDCISQSIPIETGSLHDFVFSVKFSPIGYVDSVSWKGTIGMKMHCMVRILSDDLTTNYFLSKQGWTETTTILEMEVESAIGAPVWRELKIITGDVPCTGTLQVVLYRYNSAYTSGRIYDGMAFTDLVVTFLDSGELYASGRTALIQFLNSTEPDILEDISLMCADAPGVKNNSLFYVNITRAADGTPTISWHFLGSLLNYTLQNLLGKILASNNRVARQILKGSLKGSGISFDSIIQHTYNNNRKFEIAECEWDLYRDNFTVTLLELLAYNNESITSTTVDDNNASTSPNSVSGGTIISSPTSNVGANPADFLSDSLEPTGFVSRLDNSIAFDSGTLEFEIAPVVTSFKIYLSGNPFVKAEAINVTIEDTAGMHYIYFDTDGELQVSMDPWDISSGNVPVATVYWNGSEGRLQDERHGIQMDGLTHEYLHETRGSSYAYGLTGTFPANGATFSIAAGEWYDEDIEWKNTVALDTCRIYWRISSVWNWSNAQNGIFHAVSSVAQYNSSGALAPVDTAKYSISWIFISNNTTTPVMVVMGQAQYNTQALAEAATPGSLTLGTLPAAEMLLLYRVVWQRDGAGIAVKSVADYRRLSGGPISNYVASDHAALTHLDYASSGHTGFEANLGLPAATGYILSSTDAGVRSWIEAPSGSGVDVSGTPSADDIALFSDADTIKSLSGFNVVYYDLGTGYLNIPLSIITVGDPSGAGQAAFSGKAGYSGSPIGCDVLLLAGDGHYASGGAGGSIYIYAGGGGDDANGGHVHIEPGTGEAAGNGGNVYIKKGTKGETGADGAIYLGTGSAGHLPAKSTETNVVYYNTSTGKLSYGTP